MAESLDASTGMLAIELSSRVGSVALRDRHGRIAERRFGQGDRTREPLLPEIDSLVRDAGMRPADLRAIGVSTGPGGFTGLRIAVAAAKGMAMALAIPTVAVPSTLVIAESTAREDPDSIGRSESLLVMVASKRGTAWIHRVARDARDATGWRDLAEPSAISAEAIEHDPAWRDLGGPLLLADEHQDPALIEAMLARGARRWSGAVHTPPIAASACLAIAERLFAAGRTTAPEALLPTYPREPEAVTLWNLRHREGSGRSG